MQCSSKNLDAMAMFIRFSILFLVLLAGTARASAAVPPSSITLCVDTSSSELATVINPARPTHLYKGLGGLGVSVAVLRNGPVAVSASDDFVHLTVPVQLTFSNALYESYPLRAGLRFKARVKVTPDWRLRTELYYTGLSDSLVDTLKLGPLSLKPKGMVESVSEPVQRLIAPILDAKINDAVQLRAKVAPLWRNAFSPIQVSQEFSTWLKLTPEKIVMSPLSTANNAIRLAMGVVTGAEIVVGPKPAATAVKPLPPVQLLTAFDKSFHIQLATNIFLADLVTALNPVLLEQTFGDDKKITIKDFKLKGEEGRLVVALSTGGDFKGELTLFAKPVYNPQNNTLTFENVDFDTKKTGWLISAGSWLFSSPIRRTIKTKLDAAVAEQLEQARLKASSALSGLQIVEHVKLTGAVKSLSLGEARVLNDRLSIQVVARGESSIILN